MNGISWYVTPLLLWATLVTSYYINVPYNYVYYNNYPWTIPSVSTVPVDNPVIVETLPVPPSTPTYNIPQYPAPSTTFLNPFRETGNCVCTILGNCAIPSSLRCHKGVVNYEKYGNEVCCPIDELVNNMNEVVPLQVKYI